MPRIVGLVEHVETSAEVQQWLMEQEKGVSVTMGGCGQHHMTASVLFLREPSEDEAEIDDIFRFT